MQETASSRLRQHRDRDSTELPMLSDLRRQATCLTALALRHEEFSSTGLVRLGNNRSIVSLSARVTAGSRPAPPPLMRSRTWISPTTPPAASKP